MVYRAGRGLTNQSLGVVLTHFLTNHFSCSDNELSDQNILQIIPNIQISRHHVGTRGFFTHSRRDFIFILVYNSKFDKKECCCVILQTYTLFFCLSVYLFAYFFVCNLLCSHGEYVLVNRCI